ncbi:hypothetical protein UlMin_028931 [Ulmus minor]
MVFLRWGKRFKHGKGGNLGNNLTTEKEKDNNSQFEEDDLLARAIQESLNVESPPRYDSGNTYQPIPIYYLMGYRIFVGCQTEIGFGQYLNCLNEFWHPKCFHYRDCNIPITDYEFSTSRNFPYHEACYKENYHPKCDVCKLFTPTNHVGLIEYKVHPFWIQKYCPFHEHNSTPRCDSCKRMEEFYEGLNMKPEQQVPLLLVERQALNEAREGEGNGHYHMPKTRGLCISEEQTISTISRRPRFGAGNQAMDMKTKPYKLTRRYEMTAILILYGLPSMPKLHSNKSIQIMSNYICRSSIYHLGNQKSVSSIFHLGNHSSSISKKINQFYL